MIPRHSLVWLRDGAISLNDDACAWQAKGYPFIVCRTRPDEELSLGFCQPQQNRPARLAVAARMADIERLSRPPALASAMPEFIVPVQPPCPVHIIGSRMWEELTGLSFARPDSDIDLVLDLPTASQADAAVEYLLALRALTPLRVDAELSFPERGEVHWEEWQSKSPQVLLKSTTHVALLARETLLK